MKNLLENFNKQQIKLLFKKFPNFYPGDTLKVSCKILFENSNERVQIFEGVCISKRNRGLHSSFKIRKVVYGESIISQFFIYSPSINSINVIKRGKVRRAKLYYLCSLFGKSSRIKEINNDK